jgi:hypothetical protein
LFTIIRYIFGSLYHFFDKNEEAYIKAETNSFVILYLIMLLFAANLLLIVDNHIYDLNNIDLLNNIFFTYKYTIAVTIITFSLIIEYMFFSKNERYLDYLENYKSLTVKQEHKDRWKCFIFITANICYIFYHLNS